MKTILHKIPITLLYSRLVASIVILSLSFCNVSPMLIVCLSIYAVVSDIFDGMIARKLKISTVAMRQLDTKIDTVFWFSCLFYLCIDHPDFLRSHIIQLFILVSSEIVIIIFGKLKFNARISYHTILSKFWALCLLWFFIDITINGSSYFSFTISFWYGLIVQTEILLIAIILKKNQTDVPFLLQAFRFRKGLEIKRNRIFNG